MATSVREIRRRLRRHWPIVALLLLAAALRAVVQYAYRPALIFPDSLRYLHVAQRFADGHWSPDTIRPSGYSIFIVPAAASHVLALIPLAQHVLGLAEGAMIYAVLVHRGSRRWLAALAAVPVLFDPLQLDLEQYVLSDVCATFLLVTALVILVWRGQRIGWAAITAAGLLLGAAAVTRVADLVLIAAAALYLAVTVRPWRRLAAAAGSWPPPSCCRSPATRAGSRPPMVNGASPATTGRFSTAGWFSSPTARGWRSPPTSGRCAPPSLRRSVTTTSTCGRRSHRSGSSRRRPA